MAKFADSDLDATHCSDAIRHSCFPRGLGNGLGFWLGNGLGFWLGNGLGKGLGNGLGKRLGNGFEKGLGIGIPNTR